MRVVKVRSFSMVRDLEKDFEADEEGGGYMEEIVLESEAEVTVGGIRLSVSFLGDLNEFWTLHYTGIGGLD